MKYYYDFHIHSCLSPCADMDMTPHSIAGMSYINGLDIIAVADHNSARNVRAVKKACEEFNILLVPAIEAETAENIHLLCLFKSVDDAESMGAFLEEHLPPVKNRAEIFGRQVIMDECDNETGEIETLLINATDIPIEEMKAKVESLGGVCVAAHIDREANGIVATLGTVPDYLNFKTVELSNHAPNDYKREEKYTYLKDSDAHYLTDISEKINCLELNDKNIEEIIEKLR